MLGKNKGRIMDEYVKDCVVFDLETTGTSCRRDRIIEIGALKIKDGSLIDSFSTLVNPECSIPYGASQVNGITDEMVAGEKPIEMILPVFLDFVEDLPLVGHNIRRFDMEFIYRFSRQCFEDQIPDNPVIDTLPMARHCLPQLSHYRMVDLAEYFGLSAEGAHRALFDCQMTWQVYTELGKLIPEAREKARTCPKCGRFLVRRSGRYGSFMGCEGFPDCRYTSRS